MPEEETKQGPAEWVVTFGDMMALLLTFFVILVSMSEIKEEERYQAVMESLRRMFGHESAALNMVPGEARPRNSALEKLASMGRARRADTQRGGDKVEAPVGENPRVQSIRKGQYTTGGVIYFAHGITPLKPEDRAVLRAAMEEIGGKPQKIEIRGHTSSRPLPADSPYEDHWELAYARCRKVSDALVELGVDPRRIRIAVAADNEPKHTGDDPLLQKENDRVEITMLNELAETWTEQTAAEDP